MMLAQGLYEVNNCSDLFAILLPNSPLVPQRGSERWMALASTICPSADIIVSVSA